MHVRVNWGCSHSASCSSTILLRGAILTGILSLPRLSNGGYNSTSAECGHGSKSASPGFQPHLMTAISD